MAVRVVIVTGASSGIGRAAAKIFVADGATVVAVGRNQGELAALADEVTDLSGKLIPYVCDVTELTQVDRLFIETIDQFSQIDVIVNAAGIIGSGSIENTTLDAWDDMMNINTRSVFYIMQKAVPYLEAAKGNIVNVSSITGTRAFPGVLAYCVSKAAVDQLTRCSALELAPKSIRVNAVNPGVVVTNLHRRGGMAPEAYEKFIENAVNTHPLGRAGTAEEVAELIVYLASEKASWITGATYEIDGGRAQTCAR